MTEKAVQVIGEIASAGVEVYLSGDKLKARAFKGNLQKEVTDLIKQNKSLIVDYLLQKQDVESIGISKKKGNRFPLSFSQQRLWFIDQMDGGSSHYNMASAMKVEGNFDVLAAEKSLKQIIKRHAVLRTVFEKEEEGPIQKIVQEFEFAIIYRDLSHLDDSKQEYEIQKALKQDVSKPFDLAKDVMLRVSFYRIEAKKGVMLFNMHHIASDGWSLGILGKEFAHFYQAAIEQKETSLPELPIQYSDYAEWQRDWLKGKVLEKQLNYWTNQLADLPLVHSLPLDNERPKYQTFRGASYKFHCNKVMLEDLKQLAITNQATLFMVLHAAFVCVLSRYANSNDIVVGTPVANRLQKELEPLIGFFVNTIVLRSRIKNQLSFQDFLNQVKHTNLDAQANQQLPFEQIVDNLNVGRSTSYNALFQIMFTMNTNETNQMPIDSTKFSPILTEEINAKFELTLKANERRGGLDFAFEYNRDLFDNNSIRRLGDSLQRVLKDILKNPSKKIADLEFLGQIEKDTLLLQHGTNKTSFDDQLCIHHAFEMQVKKHPENMALSFLEQKISYAELNRRANNLAHYLIKRGVEVEQIIGLCVERSAEAFIAILAILKAGAAYLPLDPKYPPKRLQYMLSDSGVKLLITQKHLAEKIHLNDVSSIQIDDNEYRKELAELSDSNLEFRQLSSSNLAYVIYTSGSTGLPKGVMIEHSGVINLWQHFNRYFDISLNSHVIQFASLGFDAAVSEWVMALLSGAKLFICDEDTRHDSIRLEKYLCDNKITHVTLPPALLTHLDVDKNYAFEALIVAGEAFDHSLSKKWGARYNFYNAYGPSESTVCSSISQPLKGSTINIGTAISNIQLYVLGDEQELLPQGTTGELYIGGAGLARGYLGKETLTAEKFVDAPFSQGSDSRLYRTGDLVRFLPTGDLEFVGRIDQQVKIRGFRIELGEIENEILEHPEIRSCVVTVIENSSSKKQIVAYVCAISEPTRANLVSDVRRSLQDSLPNYMVPSVILLIDKMPLTQNGKIDKKALPSVNSALLAEQYVAPKGEVQQKLCEIWAQVLKLPHNSISTTSNFFELGGDSILSIQVVSRAAACGYNVTVKQLFEYQTLQALASQITQKNALSISQIASTGRINLLPIQHFFFSNESGMAHYNQAVLVEVPSGFNRQLLVSFIEKVYQRHDSLRLRFNKVNGQWQGSYEDYSDKMLKLTLGEIQLDSDDFSLLGDAATEYQRSLSLTDGPLARAVICKNASGKSRLMLIIHHLVVDGVSWRIILDDLETLYKQNRAGQTLALAAKTSSFQDWTNFIDEYSRSARLSQEIDYWISEVKTPVPNFAVESTSKPNAGFGSSRFSLDRKTTQCLITDAQKAYQTKINELLLCGLLLGFYRWSGNKAIRIDLEGHGRQELSSEIDLTQTVGWFTTSYPLLLNADSMELPDLICAVKEKYRKVPNYGIGYGILKYITRIEELVNFKSSPILFNYLGQFSNETNSDCAFVMCQGNTGQHSSPLRKPDHGLSFNGVIHQGQLEFGLSFDGQLYQANEIADLMALIKKSLSEITAHCIQPDAGRLTPSDFPLSRIAESELAVWSNRYSIADIYAATTMQQGLLFHSEIESSAYVCQLSFTLASDTNLSALQKAWEQVISRHSALKTLFAVTPEGDFEQVVLQEVELPWEIKDLSELDDSTQESHLKKEQYLDKQKGFDISQAPLMRVTIWNLGHKGYRMLLSNHHAILDGWSFPLIFSEVLTCYRAEISEVIPALQRPVHYRDYIKWLSQQDKNEALEFWREELSDIEETSVLSPHSHQEKLLKDHTQQIRIETVRLDRNKTETLRLVAKDYQVTVNSLLQAAWGYLLSRYTNKKQVTFSTTVSGRPANLIGVEKMVGLFINTIPVRVDIQKKLQLSDWLKLIHSKQVEREHFSYLPLVEIQQQTDTKRLRQFNDSLLVFENYPVDETAFKTSSNDIQLNVLDLELIEETNFNLSIAAMLGEQLTLKFKAKHTHYTKKFLSQIVRHLQNILEQIITRPEQTVGDLSMLSNAERNHLLFDLNQTQRDYLSNQTLHQLFEKQASLTPDKVAINFEQQEINYQELNQRSNQLAHFLLSISVQPNTMVGLCLDRSIEMVIAMLGILKSGCGYVPIEPEQPCERIDFILSDAGIQHLIVQKQRAKLTQHNESMELIEIDCPNFIQRVERYSTANISLNRKAPHKDLAYVIYTSGSTGKPKGVLVEHSNVLAFHTTFEQQLKELNATNSSPWLWNTSMAFDASVKGLLCLLMGKGIVVASDEVSRDPERLVELIGTYGIDVFNANPNMIEALIDYVDDKKIATLNFISGGEALSQKIHRKIDTFLRHNGGQAINAYGPTETTINSSYAVLNSENKGIGRPTSNTQLYILDDTQQLMPYGSFGELYIGGAGVARGYLNREHLTIKKFIDNPFADNGFSTGSNRLYRTGDIVRYDDKGCLQFLGRIDAQVNIRGYRIELGEVEYAINLIVDSSIVVAKKDNQGGRTLIAYFVSNSTLSESDLIINIKAKLKRMLNAYMIPSRFKRLDIIPRNSNGKVDYQSLPDVFVSEEGVEYVAAASSQEKTLVTAIAKVLDIDEKKISMQNNFFELGGNSLSILKVINMLKNEQIYKSVKDFYDCETLAEINASQSESQEFLSSTPIVKLNVATGANPLFLIHPLGGGVECYRDLAQQLERECPVYGVQAPFLVNKRFNFERLTELAQYYLDEILKVQEVGPYRIGGWSVGGVIAQKIVELINARNQEVEYFFGLDSYLVNPASFEVSKLSALDRVIELIVHKSDYPFESNLDLELDELNFEQRLVKTMDYLTENSLIENNYRHETLQFIRYWIDFYSCKRELKQVLVSGKAVLFVASDSERKLLLNGWEKGVNRAYSLIDTDAKHLEMLTGEHAIEIANRLKKDFSQTSL